MRTLDRVRKICLSLPEATEKEAWGAPTFRVRKKQFAMYVDNHHGDGRVALWVKAPPGMQESLVAADPQYFFRPPYVGPAGWIGINLDKGLDWGTIAELVKEGYRMLAGKRLLAKLEG